MESSCYVALRRMTRSRAGGEEAGGWRPTVVDIGSFAVAIGEAPAARGHIPHNQVAGTRCDKVSPAPDTCIYVCIYMYICESILRACMSCHKLSPTLLRYVCRSARQLLSLRRLRVSESIYSSPTQSVEDWSLDVFSRTADLARLFRGVMSSLGAINCYSEESLRLTQ